MSGIYLISYEFILTKTHNLFSYGWVFILWASFLERCSECRSVTHAQHRQVETLPLLENWRSDRRSSETSSESRDLQSPHKLKADFSPCFLSHIMATVKFYSYSTTVWKHLKGSQGWRKSLDIWKRGTRFIWHRKVYSQYLNSMKFKHNPINSSECRKCFLK